MLPRRATDSNVVWIAVGNLTLRGWLVVINRHGGLASNYDCQTCQCPANYTGLAVTPAPINLLVNATSQEYAQAQYTNCNGVYSYSYVTASWSSQATSVATVSSSGLVTGKGGGSTTISATATCNTYTYNPSFGCQATPVTRTGSAACYVKPNISSITPPRGLIGVGTTVTISGSGFGSSQSTSTVNAGSGISLTYNSWSDTSIGATFQVAPNAPSGNNSVTVTTAQGTSNSVKFYVQVPTSLSIVAGTDSTTSEAPCTTSGGLAGCVVTRTFNYQVNDQGGQAIAAANMAVGDVICITSTNDLNLQNVTTTCGGTTGSCSGTPGPCGKFTDANGQFPETLSVCAPACKPSGVCTTAGQTVENQTWTVAGYQLSSDVKSVSVQCDKILVNGK